MNCKGCQEKLPKIGLYCSFCGKKIDKENYTPEVKSKRIHNYKVNNKNKFRLTQKEMFTQAYEAKKVIFDNFKNRWRILNILFRAFSLILIAISISVIIFGKKDGGIGLLAFSLFTLCFQIRKSWLTKKEYYSLPGAYSLEGAHRCIKCGNKGIYKKGQYQTNNTYALCSKCEEPFYRN